MDTFKMQYSEFQKKSFQKLLFKDSWCQWSFICVKNFADPQNVLSIS